jgi:hypothetical protein
MDKVFLWVEQNTMIVYLGMLALWIFFSVRDNRARVAAAANGDRPRVSKWAWMQMCTFLVFIGFLFTMAMGERWVGKLTPKTGNVTGVATVLDGGGKLMTIVNVDNYGPGVAVTFPGAVSVKVGDPVNFNELRVADQFRRLVP